MILYSLPVNIGDNCHCVGGAQFISGKHCESKICLEADLALIKSRKLSSEVFCFLYL